MADWLADPQNASSCVYWIPSVSNFANIDAAIALNEKNQADNTKKLWCLQYTVSRKHAFNSTTFRTKFLRPALRALEEQEGAIPIHIVFIVPEDVMGCFQIPSEVEEAGYGVSVVAVDCSHEQSIFHFLEYLAFIAQPVSYAKSLSEAPSLPSQKRARSNV